MKSMKIAVALLALVLVTSCIVGATFAKYTSTTTGTSSAADIAKWSFEVDDAALSDTFSFDLFNTIKELDNTTEAEVVAGKVAPGTRGSVTIVLENLSDVDATYAVDYTVDEDGIPLEWSVDGDEWTDDLADISATAIAKTSGTANIVIHWRWAFEQTPLADAADTAIGLADTAAPSVQAVVTVTQVD